MSRLLEQVWLRRVLALTLIIGVWEIAARSGAINPFYFPAPSRIGEVMVQLVVEGTIWTHLEATISAAVLGLVFGLLVGIVLGFMAALLPLVAQLLEPVMILLNAIPRVILAPLFVIWLGIDLSSKVALALILVAVLVFFAVYNGIKEGDKRLV